MSRISRQNYLNVWNSFLKWCLVMINDENMVRVTVSIDKEDLETLKKLSEKECRPYSNQIVYMMRFYIAHSHTEDITIAEKKKIKER